MDPQSTIGSYAPLTGTKTAVDQKQVLQNNRACTQGVWIYNEDESENIRVFSTDSEEGILQGPQKDRFYPVSNLNLIRVQRGGNSDATISWYAI